MDILEKGIDLSYYQGNVDFETLAKKSDVEFVILRVGYRKSLDTMFFEYARQAKAAGIKIRAVYFFSYALTVGEAEAEATFCISNMKKAGLGTDTIVFYDFEYDTVNKANKAGVVLATDDCNAHAEAFCSIVKSLGYTPGIYANLDYYKNWYKKSIIAKYPLWLADYSGDPDYACSFHQVSSTGVMPGIKGYVDIDYYYGIQNGSNETEEPGVTAVDALNIMRSWIGRSQLDGTHKEIVDIYNSHTPRARSYSVKYTDHWCDTTVSAVFIKLHAVELIGGTECGVEEHTKLFKKAGIWYEDGTVTPKPGWIIVYNWDKTVQPNDGYADHIGFVEAVNGNTITTIEGNLSGYVARRTIKVADGRIRGYAAPKYSEETSGGKTIDELAKEVIGGQWGIGTARMNALTACGYDYDAVQARVNQILLGVPFDVYVNTAVLNIRTGPGTNYSATGVYTGKGRFTIVSKQDGVGSKTGWGKLSDGRGWIALDYTTRK